MKSIKVVVLNSKLTSTSSDVNIVTYDRLGNKTEEKPFKSDTNELHLTVLLFDNRKGAKDEGIELHDTASAVFGRLFSRESDMHVVIPDQIPESNFGSVNDVMLFSNVRFPDICGFGYYGYGLVEPSDSTKVEVTAQINIRGPKATEAIELFKNGKLDLQLRVLPNLEGDKIQDVVCIDVIK